MKRLFLLFLLQGIFLVSYCQHIGSQSDLFITSYIITKSSDIIGEIRLRKSEISSVGISGPDADKFKITKDHHLLVHRKKMNRSQVVYQFTLTVKTSSGTTSQAIKILADNFTRNKVVAHRGAWKNTGAAENSIASFNYAAKLGCEGSEFDVHMSSDSLPVVNHDNAIQGISIAKTNSSELLALKLSNGESLPTLENYIKAGMEQTKTKLILEIKASELGQESTIALTRRIVAMVEQMQAQAWIDYISFDYEACKEVIKLAPYAKVAYLKGDKTPSELSADKFFGLDYHFTIIQKNPAWVQEAKDRHLTINVWTVNEKDVLEDMLKQNVDFITTNEPELLLQMVK